jgi:hypothetical protein
LAATLRRRIWQLRQKPRLSVFSVRPNGGVTEARIRGIFASNAQILFVELIVIEELAQTGFVWTSRPKRFSTPSKKDSEKHELIFFLSGKKKSSQNQIFSYTLTTTDDGQFKVHNLRLRFKPSETFTRCIL